MLSPDTWQICHLLKEFHISSAVITFVLTFSSSCSRFRRLFGNIILFHVYQSLIKQSENFTHDLKKQIIQLQR